MAPSTATAWWQSSVAKAGTAASKPGCWRSRAAGTSPLPGTLQKQPWGWRVVPLEPRLGQIISVPPTDLAEDGELVSVKLDADPNQKQLRGLVVARLGKTTDLKIENRLTAALFNLRTTFPDAVMTELAPFPTSIPEAWVKGRDDVRQTLTCTVDPPTVGLLLHDR